MLNRRDFTKRVAGTTVALALASVANQANAEPVVALTKPDLEQRAAEWFHETLNQIYRDAGTPECVLARSSDLGIPKTAQALRDRRGDAIIFPWLPPLNMLWVAEKSPSGHVIYANAEFDFSSKGAVRCRMGWPGNTRKTTILEPPK